MARSRNDGTDVEPGRNRTRLTLPLTADGSGIDFSSMRGSTKQKLHELVESDLRSIYVEAGQPDPGLEPEGETGADPFGGLTLENVHTGLDILSQANALVAQIAAPRFMRHPFKKDAKTGRPAPLVIDPDILQQCFTLTEAQHAELDPRAHRLAQKLSGRMPDWLKRNLDVYMLIGMYVRYTGENAITAMQTQVKRDVALAQQAAAKQAGQRWPIDTDRVPPGPRISEQPTEPEATGPDTYPSAGPANGGMAAEL